MGAVAKERPSRWRGASNAVEPVAAMDSQVRPSSFQWRGAESSGVSLARTSIMLARSMDKENAAPRAAAPSRGRMALKDSAQHNMVPTPAPLQKAPIGATEKPKPLSESSKGKTAAEILQELRERARKLSNGSSSASQKQVGVPVKEHQTPLGSVAWTRDLELGAQPPHSLTPYKKGPPPVEDEIKAGQDNKQPGILAGGERQHLLNVNLQLFATSERGMHNERDLESGALQAGAEGTPTAAAATVARLTSVATMSSSSGNSPSSRKDASSEEETVRSQHPPTVLTTKESSPSMKSLSAASSRQHILKRLKAFGPPRRVLRELVSDPNNPVSMESNNSWIHPLKVLPGSMPHNTSVKEEGLTDEKLDRAIAEDIGNKDCLLNAGKNQYPKETEDGARPGADSDLLSDQRKRKAEADPSRGDTSLLLAGTLAGDRSSSSTVIMEVQNDMPTNPVYMHGLESTGKIEISMGVRKHEHHAVEPSDTPKLHTGHITGSTGSEREPWAWKTSRPAQPSPVFSEHSRTGTGKIGVPSRYAAPELDLKEPGLSRAEMIQSSSSEVPKIVATVSTSRLEDLRSKQTDRVEGSKLTGGGPGLLAQGAINNLATSFGSISIGERAVPGAIGQAKQLVYEQVTNPPFIEQQHRTTVNERSLTGSSGVTGVTMQSVNLQQKPVPVADWGHSHKGPEPIDPHIQPKPLVRTSPKIPADDGYSLKAGYAAIREKVEPVKSLEEAPSIPQLQQKVRTETANSVWVNDRRYDKIGKIGKGGSSEVFKVIASDCSIYALKRISLKGRDFTSARGFCQEIEYLQRLKGKRHIIQLIDFEVTNKKVLDRRNYQGGDIKEDAFIFMVLEYGEIDLANMLSAKCKQQGTGKWKLDAENPVETAWLRLYWLHILEAVKTIHEERIVHSDLKPANFLLVKGELKLIDFGIAKAIQNDTTNIVRESQMGTVNYMSPEAFLNSTTDDNGNEFKIGRASDIWSLGCIFYQMVYGQPPFADLSFYAKIKAITNPNHKIDFPPVCNPWLEDIMKKCLTYDRRKRISIPELLQHPFLQPDTALLAPVAPTTERDYQNQIADLTRQLEELRRGSRGEDRLSNESSTSQESNGLNGRHS